MVKQEEIQGHFFTLSYTLQQHYRSVEKKVKKGGEKKYLQYS